MATTRTAAKTKPVRRRGRPHKFGRPGQVVAITLPAEVVDGLRSVDKDLAWAVVRLFEQSRRSGTVARRPAPDAELVTLGGRRSLIVVDRELYGHLPGVHIIPLHDDRAFLALEPGRGLPDLELAVIDRLSRHSLRPRERAALQHLRTLLRSCRSSRAVRVETRAIIVVERVNGANGSPARGQSTRDDRD